MQKIKLLNLEPFDYSPKARKILTTFAEVEDFAPGEFKLEEIINKYNGIITRLNYKIGENLIGKATNLKAIITATTGLDHIAIDFAKSKGIEIISLKGELEFLETISSTAEHTFALLLSLIRKIPWAFESVKKGYWDRDSYKGIELQKKTLGIIGFGRIGKMVANYALAFKMKVEFFDPFVRDKNFTKISLENLLKTSDIITIHLPYIPETKKIISEKEFKFIKKGAYLINTSRGGVIDEKALIYALDKKILSGVGLDVICEENKIKDKKIKNSPLLKYAKEHSNLLITSHIGGATVESMEKTEVFIAEKTRRFFKI